ncbi:MAG: hypothetical protein RXN81_00775 [Caldisphaera sp.]
MPSSGQLLKHEEREPISPAIPDEGIYEVNYTNKRKMLSAFFQTVFRKGSSEG